MTETGKKLDRTASQNTWRMLADALRRIESLHSTKLGAVGGIVLRQAAEALETAASAVSPETLFLVCRGIGYHDEREEDVIAAYFDEDLARQHVELATSWWQTEIDARRPALSTRDADRKEVDALWSLALAAPYDPGRHGIEERRYWFGPIELSLTLPAIPAPITETELTESPSA